MTHQLQWKKIPVLNDGFICLVDVMGNDSSIVQAARVSYGKDERDLTVPCPMCGGDGVLENPEYIFLNKSETCPKCNGAGKLYSEEEKEPFLEKDRQLIRYLLAHSHTTPFEMVEFKFLVRVPMDCWRQWIRHRTANVNEYSTRYAKAIDSQQTTSPEEWRLQSASNKQGSSGYLTEWSEDHSKLGYSQSTTESQTPGTLLSHFEQRFHETARELYEERLAFGVAKEQARKDLPLSTYTEAYWKCDLHNIFHFLRLRLDPHAQLEIRLYAEAMASIVKQCVPTAYQAFEDYVLHAKRFSRIEIAIIRSFHLSQHLPDIHKPASMTDREWKEFLTKLS